MSRPTIRSFPSDADILDCVASAPTVHNAWKRATLGVQWADTFRDPDVSGWALDSVGSRSVRETAYTLQRIADVLGKLAFVQHPNGDVTVR